MTNSDGLYYTPDEIIESAKKYTKLNWFKRISYAKDFRNDVKFWTKVLLRIEGQEQK
jgi:transposase